MDECCSVQVLHEKQLSIYTYGYMPELREKIHPYMIQSTQKKTLTMEEYILLLSTIGENKYKLLQFFVLLPHMAKLSSALYIQWLSCDTNFEHSNQR